MAWAVGPTQNGVRRGGIKSKQLSCERVRARAFSATCAAFEVGATENKANAERQRQAHAGPFYYRAARNTRCAKF